METVDRMSGTELRDHLLAIDPLDHEWVARVNQVRVVSLLCGGTSQAFAFCFLYIASSVITPYWFLSLCQLPYCLFVLITSKCGR